MVTYEKRKEIERLLAEGELSQNEIARRLGCSRCAVQNAAKGKPSKSPEPLYKQIRSLPIDAPRDFVSRLAPEPEMWWGKYGVEHDNGSALRLKTLPERVLVFSCSQAPFHQKDVLPFLSMVIADTKPDMIVMAGDLVDFKFMKKKFMGPDDLSPTQELERTIDFCQQLFRIVPKAVCLTSNHAEGRVSHAQKEGNLPSAFVRRWQDVVGMPHTWATRDFLIMRDWIVEHGDGVSKGARPSIREEMIRRFGKPLSVMRGHRHNLFGEVMVPEWETPIRQRRLCYIGCCMDSEQVDYSRTGLWNGVVLLNRGVPQPIPMERDIDNRWTGKLVEW